MTAHKPQTPLDRERAVALAMLENKPTGDNRRTGNTVDDWTRRARRPGTTITRAPARLS